MKKKNEKKIPKQNKQIPRAYDIHYLCFVCCGVGSGFVSIGGVVSVSCFFSLAKTFGNGMRDLTHHSHKLSHLNAFISK